MTTSDKFAVFAVAMGAIVVFAPRAVELIGAVGGLLVVSALAGALTYVTMVVFTREERHRWVLAWMVGIVVAVFFVSRLIPMLQVSSIW